MKLDGNPACLHVSRRRGRHDHLKKCLRLKMVRFYPQLPPKTYRQSRQPDDAIIRTDAGRRAVRPHSFFSRLILLKPRLSPASHLGSEILARAFSGTVERAATQPTAAPSIWA